MNKSQFVKKLSSFNQSSTFLTLKGYKTSHNEVSNYSILFNADYTSAIKKSINILKNYKSSDEEEEKVKNTLVNQLSNKLLSKGHDNNTKYYSYFFENKKMVKGVKVHSKNKTLYLYGFVVHKKVLKPAEYYGESKDRRSVKEKLIAMTPLGKFRQFKITADNLEKITLNKESFVIDSSF